METKHTSPSEIGLLRQTLLGRIDGEGRRLKICLISTFLFGLLAHAYGLLNLLIGHDSLHEFYWTVSRDWKFTLGRFAEPVLRYFMGEIITLPWLTGLFGILFVALAVHLLSKIFALNTVWENILLSGICVTNITVTAVIATYIHDFAGDMLSLLLCVTAAWCWVKMQEGFSFRYTLLGAGCLTAAFGLYQAYLAVTATVMCLFAIQALLQGSSARHTLVHLLRALPMVILGTAAYLGCVWLTHQIFDLAASTGDTGNDLSLVGGNLLHLGELTLKGYRQVLQDLFLPHWDSVKGVHDRANQLVSLVNIALLVHLILTFAMTMGRKAVKGWEAVLSIVLLALLPAAMTCVSIVSTAFHSLVRYAYYLFYLLVMLVSRQAGGSERWKRRLLMGLIAVVLLSNVQVANSAYGKKELEQQAALSTMTRVVSRLEAQEGYVRGESEVAILGSVAEQQEPLRVGPILGIMGLYNPSPITYPDTVADYFSIVLQYPVRIVSLDRQRQLMQTDAYRSMGVFPAADSVAEIDGVIVVKMSE